MAVPSTPAGPAQVDPTWPAPQESQRASSRRSHPYLVALLVLVLVIGGIWLAGGFQQRTDLLTEVAPGTLVVTGPYEVELTEATARLRTDSNGGRTWELTAIGTARVLGEESLDPPGTSMLAAKNPVSGVIVDKAYSTSIGDDTVTRGLHLVPGLPAVPFRALFEFPAAAAPPPTLLVLITELEFTDDSLLNTREPRWNNTDHGWRYELPVRRLPDY